jgi:hypothetical protein
LTETPEERVRQEYLCVLVNEYAFSIEHMKEEESVTGRGSGQARADFIVWRTLQDKIDDKPPLIVVECKSDNVSIKAEDYYQGDHYARMANALSLSRTTRGRHDFGASVKIGCLDISKRLRIFPMPTLPTGKSRN